MGMVSWGYLKEYQRQVTWYLSENFFEIKYYTVQNLLRYKINHRPAAINSFWTWILSNNAYTFRLGREIFVFCNDVNFSLMKKSNGFDARAVHWTNKNNSLNRLHQGNTCLHLCTPRVFGPLCSKLTFSWHIILWKLDDAIALSRE